jgi:diguanylate cyclase (GGDEF)-like protein
MSATPSPDLVTIFAQEASERFADMMCALAALDADPGDAQALGTLMLRFHTFAGMSGLDGYEIINTLGSRGEGDCRRMIAGGHPPTPDQLHRWRAIIGVMQAETEDMKRCTPSSPTAPVEVHPVAPRIYDVLIVDDDHESRTELSERLEEEGFNVNVALTRAEAMQCLEVQRPHALIVEASLPDGLGYDVIERLRAIQDNNNPAVFIVSHGGAFLDRVEAIRSGADGVFSKPLDCDRLVHRLRLVVQSRDAAVARILSVEDDPDQAAYLRTVLEGAGCAVRTCSDPSRFEAELASFVPDLILMDILLPEVSGYELARVARLSDEHQTTPILFLTTQGQLQTRIQSMRSGGDDHIVKPVAPKLLVAAVESRIERARQIRQFLDRDNLTGLLNRGAFLRRMNARIRSTSDRPAALVMLDVDRFKLVNDHHGHAFGDQVLSSLGTFLRKHVRLSDSVCRYGGEEFTLLIDEVSEEEAIRLIDRLRQEFASIRHITPAGKTIFVTFSAGVAPLPRSVAEAPHALEAADAASYRAKAEGRNRVCGTEQRYPARISA